MHKKLAIFTVLAVLGVIGAGGAVAGQPAEPGCFGQDRAANLVNGAWDPAAPGASEWGAEAATRAGTNGAQNQAYKTGCGGDPS